MAIPFGRLLHVTEALGTLSLIYGIYMLFGGKRFVINFLEKYKLWVEMFKLGLNMYSFIFI